MNMPYDELQGWFEYFRVKPYEWRDDDRAAKFIQTQGTKAKVWDIFPSLKSIYNPDRKDKGIKGSSIFKLLQNAKGGDSINFGGQ